MKTIRLISIALVVIMSLTVVSGAGVMTAQALTWVKTPPTSDEIADVLDCSDLGLEFTLSGEGSDNAILAATAASGDTYSYYNDRDGLALDYSTDSQSATASITLTTEVVGPGTVTFAWYVGADLGAQTKLEFFINPTDAKPAASATINDYEPPTMTDVAPITIPTGTHQLMWRISTEGGPVNVAASLDWLRFMPSAVSKDIILQDLATLRSTVMATPNSAFYSGTKSAMLAIIDAATLQTKYGRYGAAAYTLQSKFIPRIDGCALRGTPDTLDLVRTCPAQAPLFEQANSLMQDLQLLQANPP